MFSKARILSATTSFTTLPKDHIHSIIVRKFATKPKNKTGLPPGQNTVQKVRLAYQRKQRKMAEDKGDKAEMSAHIGDEITRSIAEAQSKNEPVDLDEVRQIEIDDLLAMAGYSIDPVPAPVPKAATNGTAAPAKKEANITTQVLEIDRFSELGEWAPQQPGTVKHKKWYATSKDAEAMAHLRTAAEALRKGNHPVAFPTETVYGLGADATSSRAVRGIYEAKGRPSDNPLIVHISDRDMLKDMMSGLPEEEKQSNYMKRYEVLMDKFWPGPLTLLIPKPPNYLCDEVTAGLDTVGIRMPNSTLALSLIKLAQKPIAAPSANSSTKPSPTTAAHVYHDLHGKIEFIVDGGPCNVGVESTVVDGLRDPPLILRPGGVSIDDIKKYAGWEQIAKGYKDESEMGEAAPKAPGMKYKHYSPKAKVILCENGYGPEVEYGQQSARIPQTVGIIRTHSWERWLGLDKKHSNGIHGRRMVNLPENGDIIDDESGAGFISEKAELKMAEVTLNYNNDGAETATTLIDVDIGPEPSDVATWLFAALREMDKRSADVIFVEGIKDDGGIGAAVMNRLRKASSEKLG